jgi:phosphate transport system substrate-binding protein
VKEVLSTTRRTTALALAALFAAAACGTGTGASPSAASQSASGASGGEESGAASSGTGGEPAEGEINISGSSTVLPISQGMQELFNEQNPDVAIRVDGPGTGDGFELFCAGETDISNASRAIREEEAAACEEAGIAYVELQVAIDGLSILTSPANEAVTCLSYADLYALVGPESEGVNNWNDAEALAKELGSTTDLPDGELTISGPGEESGTYDYFVEEVVGEFAADQGQEEVTRKDYNSNPNDNVIIEGVTGSDTSLGWVGYAYAVENEGAVKLLEVSAPDGECVAPTPETIASNEYPLSRPLFIYVNTANAEENPALAAFVDFHLDPANLTQIVEETGYVNLDEATVQETVSAWEGR